MPYYILKLIKSGIISIFYEYIIIERKFKYEV
jgi:hypothetical protein